MRRRTTTRFLAGVLLLTLGAIQPAMAEDGKVVIHESTLDEFGTRLVPVNLSGQEPVEIDEPFCFFDACTRIRISICGGDWFGNIMALDFSISGTEGVVVTGTAQGVFSCITDLPWVANFRATGAVSYDDTLRAMRINVTSDPVTPCVGVPVVGTVCVDPVDIGPAISIPPIPLSTGWFTFGTATGQEQLHVTTDNVDVTVEDGLITLTTDIVVW